MDFRTDPRFSGIIPFEKKLWLSGPTMHGDEQKWVDEAIRTNWVSTIGENINSIERDFADMLGCQYAVALSCGTAALHLAIKLAGVKLYGTPQAGRGALEGKKVFASDMTFDATVNPIAYEGGQAVLIDTERETWNMDPLALQKAFELYPDVKLVVVAHLYGSPAKIEAIRKIAHDHGALVVEDAAESLGATFNGRQTGTFGDLSVISFNGNKIITGSSGGMLLCEDKADADRIRKWSTQSRECAPWYQHEEIGYNYRMSNIIAGVVRGQLPYLYDHIAQKKAVRERYEKGLADLPIQMNPFDKDNSSPNFWLSCLTIRPDAMEPFSRGEQDETWTTQSGKSCPGEILGAVAAFGGEGRPIWKPMHLQPIYRANPFVTTGGEDVGADIFQRGLCLPSDNKMTPDQQDKIIEIIHRCFR